MKTPSHAIINLAILGRSQQPDLNLPIAIGGILPDIPIFLFYFWAKFIAGMPEAQIWSEAYYAPATQNIVALFHSIPLAAIAWIISSYLGWEKAQILCLSLILHSVGDLPVHHDDAHQHFYPFSNYRFISPFSYWDVNHYGSIVSSIELLLVLISTSFVFPMVQSWLGRILIVLVNLVYIVAAIRRVY